MCTQCMIHILGIDIMEILQIKLITLMVVAIKEEYMWLDIIEMQ